VAILNNGTIIDRIASFIERFVFLPRQSIYRLLATWVLATYVYKQFEFIGYIFSYSSEPQSGKSRLLEVLDLLVFNSSGILVSPTEAVLFRTADNATQLLDEVDAWTNRDVLRSVLNAGFRNGGTVPRMKEQGSSFEVEKFPVYGPRALAGIGDCVLDQTTRDRTFMIQMMRQKPEERREPFRRTVRTEASVLKVEIEHWAKQNAKLILDRYDGAFPYLEHFRDRTIDVAQSLATILEVCYCGNTGLEAARLELIEAVAVTRKDQESLTEEHRILCELTRVARIKNPLVGMASELADQCTDLAEKPSDYAISAMLRRYGFQTKSVRMNGDPKYRYVLDYQKLADIASRYATVESIVE
jgi:hypothetical protein